MSRRRTYWTRARYRKASSLSRYFARWVYELPSEPPALLQRFFELWEQHPQKPDPLRQSMRYRPRYNRDDIPF